MRPTISWVTALAIAFQPLVSYADPMDAARESVVAATKVMNKKVMAQIQNDFGQALGEALQHLSQRPDVRATQHAILTGQVDLRKEFERIAGLNASEISQLGDKVNEVFQRYKALTQKRYDLSYAGSDTRAIVRENILFARLALQKFAQTCDSGSGIGGVGQSNFYYPSMPEPQVSIEFGTDEEGRLQIGAAFVGTGTQGEANRNAIMGISTGIGGTTGGLATFGTGAVKSSALLAAPWAVGGMIVLTAVMLYISNDEYIKAQNRIVDAHEHAFRAHPTDDDAARSYKEQCTSLNSVVQKILLSVDAHFEGSAQSQDLLSSAKALDELGAYQKMVQERKALIDRLSTQEGRRASEQERIKNEVARIDGQIEEFNKSDRFVAIVTALILDQQSELQVLGANKIWEAVDVAQRRAFNQLSRIIHLTQRKAFAHYLDPKSDMAGEANSLAEFMRAKKLFRETLAIQIKQIFGVASEVEVQALEQELRAATKRLLAKHAAHAEVSNFARQTRSLLGGL